MSPILAPIQHVVVLMLENRSYDNVLGWLYGPNNATAPPGQKHLRGLSGTESNPNPYTGEALTVHEAAPNTIGGSGQIYSDVALPLVDPNETFGNMAQQYLGVAPDTPTPYANYHPSRGVMSGYLNNYRSAPKMSAANVGDVMTYLTPRQLPVTSYLAQNFGVCDEWYASVPSQTFVNRLFALSAAPQIISRDSQYSVVDDADHSFHFFELLPESDVVETASLFSQLDAAGAPWKLYFHDYSIAMFTMPYLTRASSRAKISTFDNSDWGAGTAPLQLKNAPASTFVDDVKNGTLPSFVFIEPRYNLNLPTVTNDLPPNSNHPGAGHYGVNILTRQPLSADPSDPPIDVNGGELLLMQVYNLIRTSDYWGRTLLIVTYDEAGGLYDHMPPVRMTPPGNVYTGTSRARSPLPAARSKKDVAANGFDYTVGGGRVPAIIISPHIAKASTIRDARGLPFDHSSIVKTVFDCFALAEFDNALPSLTARDAAAPSLSKFILSGGDNNPPPFSGTIIPSPAMVILTGDRTLHVATATLLASAGPGIALTATARSITTYENNNRNWVSVTPAKISTAPDVTAWTIGYNLDAVFGFHGATLQGQVEISDGTTSINVPVWLYLT